MKRSRAVPLTLLASAAASLAACSRSEPMRCVEANSDRVVPDSLCGPAPRAGSSGIGMGAPFLWYYGGRVLGGGALGIGGRVNGGAYTPVAGARYRSPAGVTRGAASNRATSRGGFGSSGGRGVGG